MQVMLAERSALTNVILGGARVFVHLYPRPTSYSSPRSMLADYTRPFNLRLGTRANTLLEATNLWRWHPRPVKTLRGMGVKQSRLVDLHTEPLGT